MLKIYLLILFFSLMLWGKAQSSASNQTSVLNAEFSSGLFLLNGISSSNLGYRFDYGTMVINPKINFGLNYYFGFTNSAQVNYETAYNEYFTPINGYNNVDGYAISKVKSDIRLINLGGNISFNKYIKGNYFDGGLYTTLGIGIDYFHIISNDMEIISTELVENLPRNKKYYNPEGGGIFGGTASLKLGYDFPLSKINFGVFTSLDKSFFSFNTDSRSDIAFETPGYTIVRVGIRFVFVGFKL